MTAPPVIRIAAAQYPLDRLPTLAAVKAKISDWVARAADGGADLVLFPEYAGMELAGPADDRIAQDLQLSLAAVSDALAEIDAHHADLARRHRIHVLAGSAPRRGDDGRYLNAARLFTPGGQVGRQDKLMMTPFERAWGIVPGREVTVFDTRLGRLAILICYDSEFPLLARAAADAGARLFLIPACTERVSGFHRVRTGALSRALENTCASVLSPTVGDALWSPAIDHNAGAAGIYVPSEHGVSDTGVLVEGPLNSPHLLIADVDLERLARLKREGGEMRNAEDWTLQPGAGALPQAKVVDLR